MIEIVWDDKFKGIYKKWSRKHPDLVGVFRNKLHLFAKNPFQYSLRTHSLTGNLKGLWSLWINYEYRLIFEFVAKDKQRVLLIDIGIHDEVY